MFEKAMLEHSRETIKYNECKTFTFHIACSRCENQIHVGMHKSIKTEEELKFDLMLFLFVGVFFFFFFFLGGGGETLFFNIFLFLDIT